MINKQKLTKRALKKLLKDKSILDAIHQGHYREVIENDVPAKKISGGRSLIISYYQGSQYICTKHELRTKTDRTVHQDVEAAFINNIRYDRK
jgi:hypothetical protein